MKKQKERTHYFSQWKGEWDVGADALLSAKTRNLIISEKQTSAIHWLIA